MQRMSAAKASRALVAIIVLGLIVLGLIMSPPAAAADIRVLSAGAVEAPLEAVVHAFERESGHKVTVTFGTVGALQGKLKAGDKADVVILSTVAVAAMEKDRAVLSGSRVALGRAETALAVREGAPLPDISTPEAFKTTLLAAKSVAFTDPASGGSSGTYFLGLLDRMGIADEVKTKTVPCGGGRQVAEAVANGAAEVGVTFASEILPVKGAKVVGALPKEIQFVNEYSAFIPAASSAVEPARALLAFLGRPESRDMFKSAGLLP
jgi:molybdate transport system substrate-binding protein